MSAAARELRRFRYPHAVLPLRLGAAPVPEEIVARILGHVALFMLIVIGGTVVVAVLGADLVTASSAVISVMSNMGPGLGEAGPASNFLVFTRPARGVLMFLMLVGRLEMLAVLVGITRLWRLGADRRLGRRGWVDAGR